MHIRRTTYFKLGQAISLPFIACIADQHPAKPSTAHRQRHHQRRRRNRAARA